MCVWVTFFSQLSAFPCTPEIARRSIEATNLTQTKFIVTVPQNAVGGNCRQRVAGS
jgi:hypothetical protein